MIAAAALCPAPPLLVRELTGADAGRRRPAGGVPGRRAELLGRGRTSSSSSARPTGPRPGPRRRTGPGRVRARAVLASASDLERRPPVGPAGPPPPVGPAGRGRREARRACRPRSGWAPGCSTRPGTPGPRLLQAVGADEPAAGAPRWARTRRPRRPGRAAGDGGRQRAARASGARVPGRAQRGVRRRGGAAVRDGDLTALLTSTRPGPRADGGGPPGVAGDGRRAGGHTGRQSRSATAMIPFGVAYLVASLRVPRGP